MEKGKRWNITKKKKKTTRTAEGRPDRSSENIHETKFKILLWHSVGEEESDARGSINCGRWPQILAPQLKAHTETLLCNNFSQCAWNLTLRRFWKSFSVSDLNFKRLFILQNPLMEKPPSKEAFQNLREGKSLIQILSHYYYKWSIKRASHLKS